MEHPREPLDEQPPEQSAPAAGGTPEVEADPGDPAADADDAGVPEPGEREPPLEERSLEEEPPVEERSLEELAATLAQAELARDEYLDHLRRERAEFENFRKRANKDRMGALDRGAESVVASLLGVLDNFGFVLDAAEGSSDDQLAKGARMVHSELLTVLRQAGLDDVPGVGAPFDPTWHEAMMKVSASEALGSPVDGPVVAEVLRPGYRFKGRVLRPASVSVAE